jgi:hypothetical protein
MEEMAEEYNYGPWIVIGRDIVYGEPYYYLY